MILLQKQVSILLIILDFNLSIDDIKRKSTHGAISSIKKDQILNSLKLDNGSRKGLYLIGKICNLQNNDYFSKGKKFVRIQNQPNIPEISFKNQKTCYCCDILVVDDEQINAKALKLLLKKQKITAESCGDGSEAVDRVKYSFTKSCCNVKYKLIFMDLMMPIMKGDEASKIISKIYKDKGMENKLDIIVVSAHESDDILYILKDIPCFRKFIPKPPNKKVIEEVIYKYYLKGESVEKKFSHNFN